MENILPIYMDRFSCRHVMRPYNKVALSCIDDARIISCYTTRLSPNTNAIELILVREIHLTV